MSANQESQCDYCAFKVTEDQSTLDTARRIEEKYSVLRNLIGAPKKTRKVFVGGDDDKTETCFINSPNWVHRKENIHCPDRKPDVLSLESALGFRETEFATTRAEEANALAREANDVAREANSLARRTSRLAILANIIAIIAIIIAAIAARADINWLISWAVMGFSISC